MEDKSSLAELKARAFDIQRNMAFMQSNLQALVQQISTLESVPTEVEEKPK